MGDDETHIGIFDLNYYCLHEIVSYVPDLVALELAHPHFRQFTHYFYARRSIELTDIHFEDIPEWLWTKMGQHVVELTLTNCDLGRCGMEKLFNYFQNLQILTFINTDIYRAPNMPTQLEALTLENCHIMDDCNEWLQQLSPTLVKVNLLFVTIHQRLGVENLQNMKHAQFLYTMLENATIYTFLKNNRNSLESLAMHRASHFDVRCHDALNDLQKLTSLAIDNDVVLLTDRLCEKIEHFQSELLFPGATELVFNMKQLRSLTTSSIRVQSVKILVTSLPALETLQLSMPVRIMNKRTRKAFKKLSSVVRALERKFTLNLSENKVNL